MAQLILSSRERMVYRWLSPQYACTAESPSPLDENSACAVYNRAR